MNRFLVLFLVFAVALGAWLLWRAVQRRRRERLAAEPFPASWERQLSRRWSLYPRLTPEEKTRLQRYIHLFLGEKQFIGCAGFTVDESVRLLIAAQACLPLLGREHPVPYPSLATVLVYPSGYVAPEEHLDEAGVVTEGRAHRLGESWDRGHMVLAWDEIEADLGAPDDGVNLVLHECAHQLDQADGRSDGAPPLERPSEYRDWAQVFQREYDELCRAVDEGHDTLIDPYGATDPAEFFAVVSEAFFEIPSELEDAHPELFRQLHAYYQLDPRRWH